MVGTGRAGYQFYGTNRLAPTVGLLFARRHHGMSLCGVQRAQPAVEHQTAYWNSYQFISSQLSVIGIPISPDRESLVSFLGYLSFF
jgi:hypothetical protein